LVFDLFWLRVKVLEMVDNSKDIEKWLKLINADGVGPVTFKKIFEKSVKIQL
jgi:hypothetical protein